MDYYGAEADALQLPPSDDDYNDDNRLYWVTC